MTWMIVVVFATLAGDVYIFTDPTFETQTECREYMTDVENIPGLVDKMFTDYGRQMPIRAVNCLEEDKIKSILEKYNLDPMEQKTAV